MTLDQIQSFIEETVAQNRRWKRIYIIGGEATLHPQIFEIVEALLAYKRRYAPKTHLLLVSNGTGPHVSKIFTRLAAYDGLDTSSSANRSNPRLHVTANDAPIDHPEYDNVDYANACMWRKHYGMGLSRSGYYPCEVGGALDRMLGLNIGRQTLPNSDDDMRDQLEKLCRHCGHFKRYNFYSFDLVVSKSWEEVIRRYRQVRPVLTLYGAKNARGG